MPNDALEMLWVSSESMIRPGHDEGAVADPVDLLDARADGRAEDDEIERVVEMTGDEDALHERAPGARHLEAVDGADRRGRSSAAPAPG